MFPFEKSAMVWGVIGSLGSGKSLVSVANIYKNLQIGSCLVVTNIKLNSDLISKELNFDVTPFLMYVNLFDKDFDFNSLPWGSHRGQTQRKRVIVVIDEVAEFFDQYTKGNDGQLKRFVSWLRHSSKRGQDVILICQHPKFMNLNLRNIIHRWVFCANLSQYKIPLIMLPLFPNFSVTKILDKYQSIVRGGFWLYSQKKWGKFYDTSQIIQDSDIKETTFNTYKIPFNYNLFFIRLFFVVFLIKVGFLLWLL